MNHTDPIKCKQLTALVPGYLDGELSEEQATPLRRHLLSCPSCRKGAADLTNLKRWTRAAAPSEGFVIPAGFAARVAQAAFGGELHSDDLQPNQAGRSTRAGTATATSASDSSVLSFVLGLTTLAAALLISLSFLIGVQGQPQGTDLSAQPMPDMLPDVLRDLDELNAKELRLEKAKNERGIEKERGRVKR